MEHLSGPSGLLGMEKLSEASERRWRVGQPAHSRQYPGAQESAEEKFADRPHKSATTL